MLGMGLVIQSFTEVGMAYCQIPVFKQTPTLRHQYGIILYTDQLVMYLLHWTTFVIECAVFFLL